MNILISSYTLDLSGVPTFTLTMYDELTKMGNYVEVYSPIGGKLESRMRVIKDIDKLTKPDVIIAQHNICAEDLHAKFPTTPLIFYSHGLLPEGEQPPKFECDFYFAINEEVKENLISKGVQSEKIGIIRDFVDTEKFKLLKPINKTLQNVLFISNYKKWKNFKTIEAACTKLHLNLKCVGAPYGRSYNIEEEINKADLVISWGRGILEAMSCGRPVLSFDRQEGDGYINLETYLKARENNFSGRVYKHHFDSDTLSEEMLKYNAKDGVENRKLIEKYHGVKDGVKKIDEYLRHYEHNRYHKK